MNLSKSILLSAFCSFILFIPMSLMAQLNDGFTDGDFSDNPEWTGNTGMFIVNPAFQLQLNSSGDGTSYLSSTVSMEGLTEWRVWVNLAFSPSDNNNARIYLVADQPDISQPLNGFFLQLGENLSADAIELYRQSGTVTYPVCRGIDGFIGTAFSISIRVVRTAAGIWNVYADPAGGEDFQFQASGEDATWESYSHFGVYCKYTSSNATKFFFDNIYAGPLVFDDIKPILLSAEVTGATEVSLNFSEPVNETSASTTANYSVDQGIGNPLTAQRDINSTSTVKLNFSQPVNLGTVFNLTVKDVADLAGNVMVTTTIPFAFYNIHAFDVVINEIMADPDPAVGLPAYEYAELYNRSDLPVQLENWVLSIGTTKKLLTLVFVGTSFIPDSDQQ